LTVGKHGHGGRTQTVNGEEGDQTLDRADDAPFEQIPSSHVTVVGDRPSGTEDARQTVGTSCESRADNQDCERS
jgi:hypothetical protein